MRKLLSLLAFILACTVPALADQTCGTVTLISGTAVAAAANQVQLPGVAGRTTYVSGFTVTTGAVLAAVGGVFTVSTGSVTLNYQISEAIGTGQVITVIFPYLIPASTQNAPITLNLPAITGGGVSAISAYGCQF